MTRVYGNKGTEINIFPDENEALDFTRAYAGISDFELQTFVLETDQGEHVEIFVVTVSKNLE